MAPMCPQTTTEHPRPWHLSPPTKDVYRTRTRHTAHKQHPAATDGNPAPTCNNPAPTHTTQHPQITTAAHKHQPPTTNDVCHMRKSPTAHKWHPNAHQQWLSASYHLHHVLHGCYHGTSSSTTTNGNEMNFHSFMAPVSCQVFANTASFCLENASLVVLFLSLAT